MTSELVKDSGIQAVDCPFCNYASKPRFSVPYDHRKPDTMYPYTVFWCPSCDYGFVWPRPTPDEIATFYDLDDYYTHSSKTTHADDISMSKFGNRFLTHLAWRLDRGSDLSVKEVDAVLCADNRNVCDIGCGNGGLLQEFEGGGYRAFGVEPDPQAREQAGRLGLEVYDGTAETLPESIASNQFGVVIMSHVLEHCENPGRALKSAFDILVNRGVFVVETPNCQALGFQKYEGCWPWTDLPRHLNFFTRKSLSAAVERCGFRILEVRYRGFCRQFTPGWLAAEEAVWEAFAPCASGAIKTPAFRRRAWRLLLRSVIATKGQKYDSVRLIVTKG